MIRSPVALLLSDASGQAAEQRPQGREEPEAPPQWARQALDHLVTAEAAVAIERSGDAAAPAALVKLQAAVSAARLVCVIEDHRGLVAPRTQARSDER